MNFKTNFQPLILLSILLVGCTTPQNCPVLEFNPIEKITTVDGVLYTGRCVTFKDGNKRSIQQYINGIDYGNWVFFYPDGEIETKGKFKNGSRIGKWKYYFSNGKISEVVTYTNEGIKRRVKYDTVGNIIGSIKY